MSVTEIERFNSDVKRDPHLREQLKQRTLAGIVAFAAERGYSFNADEANAYPNANGSTELSDAQLAAVTGGALLTKSDWGTSWGTWGLGA
jgi:predicted ribosomally synthesized peptide with nif11-like leader